MVIKSVSIDGTPKEDAGGPGRGRGLKRECGF